eukprot:4448480-Lingulodinium_polyedra.AAC.1
MVTAKRTAVGVAGAWTSSRGWLRHPQSRGRVSSQRNGAWTPLIPPPSVEGPRRARQGAPCRRARPRRSHR